MNRNRIPKTAMQYEPEGKRYKERPRKRWIEAGTDLQPPTIVDMIIMIISQHGKMKW